MTIKSQMICIAEKQTDHETLLRVPPANSTTLMLSEGLLYDNRFIRKAKPPSKAQMACRFSSLCADKFAKADRKTFCAVSDFVSIAALRSGTIICNKARCCTIMISYTS